METQWEGSNYIINKVREHKTAATTGTARLIMDELRMIKYFQFVPPKMALSGQNINRVFINIEPQKDRYANVVRIVQSQLKVCKHTRLH